MGVSAKHRGSPDPCLGARWRASRQTHWGRPLVCVCAQGTFLRRGTSLLEPAGTTADTDTATTVAIAGAAGAAGGAGSAGSAGCGLCGLRGQCGQRVRVHLSLRRRAAARPPPPLLHGRQSNRLECQPPRCRTVAGSKAAREPSAGNASGAASRLGSVKRAARPQQGDHPRGARKGGHDEDGGDKRH